jgi:hypothetical protein
MIWCLIYAQGVFICLLYFFSLYFQVFKCSCQFSISCDFMHLPHTDFAPSLLPFFLIPDSPWSAPIPVPYWISFQCLPWWSVLFHSTNMSIPYLSCFVCPIPLLFFLLQPLLWLPHSGLCPEMFSLHISRRRLMRLPCCLRIPPNVWDSWGLWDHLAVCVSPPKFMRLMRLMRSPCCLCIPPKYLRLMRLMRSSCCLCISPEIF